MQRVTDSDYSKACKLTEMSKFLTDATPIKSKSSLETLE